MEKLLEKIPDMTDEELSSVPRLERETVSKLLIESVHPERMTYEELCEKLRGNA